MILEKVREEERETSIFVVPLRHPLVASCMCRDPGDQTLNLGLSGERSELLNYLSGQGFRFVILMLAVYLKRKREAVGGEGSKFKKLLGMETSFPLFSSFFLIPLHASGYVKKNKNAKPASTSSLIALPGCCPSTGTPTP